MFLKKELAWVRQGPRAQRSKQKDRFERYYDIAAQDGPVIEEDMELVIPPPPQLGNRTVEVSNLGMDLGGRALFSGFSFTSRMDNASAWREEMASVKPRC